jgi:hypothetical protein
LQNGLKNFSPREQETIKAITSQGFTINSGVGAVQLNELAKLEQERGFDDPLKKRPTREGGPRMFSIRRQKNGL